MAIFQASDYGALGDGSSNDTAALQAAIDAASAAGGGTVKLTAGTYIISGENGGAALTLPDNVTLEGPAGYGTAAVLKLADGAADTSALLSSTGDNTGARFLTLDGNRANTTGEVSGWVNHSSTGVVLDRVVAEQLSGYGLDLRGDGGQVNVSRAYVQYNGADGIIASGLVDSQLSDTTVTHNDGSGLNLTGALEVLDIDSTHNAAHGVLLQGEGAHLVAGSISNEGLDGVYLDHTQGANLEYVAFTSLAGVQLQAVGADGTTLSHNMFLTGNDSTGVVLTDSTDTQVLDNRFTHWLSNGGGEQPVSLVETGSSDGTQVEGNYLTPDVIAPTLVGDSSELLGNTTTVYSYGTAQADKIFYYTSLLPVDRVVYGGEGNDQIIAGVGDITLIGGAGRDTFWGTRADQGSVTFRYDSVADSYRTATVANGFADQIRYFNVSTDKLDLVSLGITGIGDGHDGTLAVVYSAAKDVTYLKSYDADAEGRRFELGLTGDYRGLLTSANFQAFVEGTSGNDSLYGTTHGEETLLGGAGRDNLYGRGSDDRLDGGAGGDRLSGGAGADTFMFSSLEDSQVSASGGTSGRDRITDFDANGGDRLDVSALGFTGLGDGSGTTLAVAYSSSSDLTRLYSTETTASGGHFEVVINGDQAAALQRGGIDFALTDQGQVVDSSPIQRLYQTGTAHADTLTGTAAEELLVGGAGNDRIDGGANTDWLTGGEGVDRLTGGSGVDIFIFTSLADSYRQGNLSQSDLITDFAHGRDMIDVSALGFTDLGDGTHGTLNVSYNAALDRTYLRSFTTDDQGRAFQVTFSGDQTATLTYNHFDFANQSEVALTLLGQGADAVPATEAAT